VDAEGTEGNECFEGSVDTVALDVTMKEAPDLILRQSVIGGLDRFADTVGDGVSGRHAEEEGGAVVAVIPNGEGSLEMGQADDGGGVQGGVDGAETQDLGLGATGGGAVQTGLELAQVGIAVLPKLARGGIAAKEDFGSDGSPVESTAEFAGHRSQIGGGEASTFGKAVAAVHPGPETAVGKTVVGFGAVEILSELLLGDVSNQAERSRSDSCPLPRLSEWRTEANSSESARRRRSVGGC
jgi:hypothetical protein